MLTLDWYRFFGSQLGVIAGLTGFVLIAISINLKLILDLPGLPGRAAEALIAPIGAVTVNALILVPELTSATLGAGVFAVGVVMVVAPIVIQIRARRHHKNLGLGKRVGRFALSAGVGSSFVVGGAHLFLDAPRGLYWIAAGDLLLVVAVVVTAWVLLIEIQR